MTRAESSPGVRAVVALLIVALAATLIAPVAVGAEHVDHVDSAVVDGETNPAVESFSGHLSGDPGPAAQTAGDDADVIRLRNELAQTDERGTVGVTTRAEIPDRVTELEVTLLSAADGDADIEADGFVPADDAGPDESVWEWDGDTADPSLTYAIDANDDTIEEEGPLLRPTAPTASSTRASGRSSEPPRRRRAWSYTGQYEGQVRLDRETVAAGEGVASQSMAFLGPHEEHVREAAGQQYRLIVPDAADPVASPDEVFGAFENASTALQVGARDETVVAFVAPTGEVSWAVRGLQTGDADLWVGTGNPPARPRTSGPTSTYTPGRRTAPRRAASGSRRRARPTTPRCSRSTAALPTSTRSSARWLAASASPTPRRCFPTRPRGTDTPTTRRVRSSPARSTAGSGPRPTVPRSRDGPPRVERGRRTGHQRPSPRHGRGGGRRGRRRRDRGRDPRRSRAPHDDAGDH